jgi:hypothetical protein
MGILALLARRCKVMMISSALAREADQLTYPPWHTESVPAAGYRPVAAAQENSMED